MGLETDENWLWEKVSFFASRAEMIHFAHHTRTFPAQNPAQRTHRIERREVYHDGIKEDNNHLFRFAKLEGYGNLTIQVGSTAYLHCPVVNLGERPVSHTQKQLYLFYLYAQLIVPRNNVQKLQNF